MALVSEDALQQHGTSLELTDDSGSDGAIEVDSEPEEHTVVQMEPLRFVRGSPVLRSYNEALKDLPPL